MPEIDLTNYSLDHREVILIIALIVVYICAIIQARFEFRHVNRFVVRFFFNPNTFVGSGMIFYMSISSIVGLGIILTGVIHPVILICNALILLMVIKYNPLKAYLTCRFNWTSKELDTYYFAYKFIFLTVFLLSELDFFSIAVSLI